MRFLDASSKVRWRFSSAGSYMRQGLCHATTILLLSHRVIITAARRWLYYNMTAHHDAPIRFIQVIDVIIYNRLLNTGNRLREDEIERYVVRRYSPTKSHTALRISEVCGTVEKNLFPLSQQVSIFARQTRTSVRRKETCSPIKSILNNYHINKYVVHTVHVSLCSTSYEQLIYSKVLSVMMNKSTSHEQISLYG